MNSLLAITEDRAQVLSSIAAEDYAQQKPRRRSEPGCSFGSSTSAMVLQQQRALAAAENSLIQANATYAKDRAGLYQTLSSTLEHYGINLQEAATGNVTMAPVVPGLTPAKQAGDASTPPAANQ